MLFHITYTYSNFSWIQNNLPYSRRLLINIFNKSFIYLFSKHLPSCTFALPSPYFETSTAKTNVRISVPFNSKILPPFNARIPREIMREYYKERRSSPPPPFHVKTIETADHEEEAAIAAAAAFWFRSITLHFLLIISIYLSSLIKISPRDLFEFRKLWKRKNRARKSEEKKRNRGEREDSSCNEREREGLSVLNRSESVSYANDVCCSCAAGKREGESLISIFSSSSSRSLDLRANLYAASIAK